MKERTSCSRHGITDMMMNMNSSRSCSSSQLESGTSTIIVSNTTLGRALQLLLLRLSRAGPRYSSSPLGLLLELLLAAVKSDSESDLPLIKCSYNIGLLLHNPAVASVSWSGISSSGITAGEVKSLYDSVPSNQHNSAIGWGLASIAGCLQCRRVPPSFSKPSLPLLPLGEGSLGGSPWR